MTETMAEMFSPDDGQEEPSLCTARLPLPSRPVTVLAAAEVCRVCLAMDVKMYHISKFKLRAMYENVTGVEINTEHELPEMLCWECVARLASANNFIEKALRTQRILKNKIQNCRFITKDDITSIDRAQNQLLSTLGPKLNKANDSNILIIEETIKIENITDNDKTIGKAVDRNIEFRELEAEIDFDFYKGPDQIKTEQVEIHVDEATAEADNNYVTDCKQEDISQIENVNTDNEALAFSVKDEYLGEDVPVENVYSETLQEISESCEGITQRWPTSSPTDDEDTMNLMIDLGNSNQSSTQTNQLFICDICDKTYHDKYVLIRHIRLKHTESNSNIVLNCILCRYTTNRKEMLRHHVNSKHTKSISYNCTYCSYKANQKAHLAVHVNAKHTKRISFNCSYCSYKASQKSHLTVHIKAKHINSTPFNCSYCSFKTNQKAVLNNHVNAKHTQSVSFDCPYCSYKTYHKGCLRTHVKTKHIQKRTFECTYCDYKAYQKYQLAVHVNAKHTKSISFKCSYCSYEASQKSHLTVHINAKHIKLVTTPLNCSYCSFKTNKKTVLNDHINAKHTQSVSFNCPYCSYKSYQKGCLRTHIKTKHTHRNEFFKCSYCDYKAFQKAHLQTHVNAKHINSTSHNCPHCSYKANQKSVLNSHINSKHTKSISYDCSHCSYKTFTRQGLYRHNKQKHS